MSDICELSEFLDSGAVTAELRGMFKNDCSSDISMVNQDEASLEMMNGAGCDLTSQPSPSHERSLRMIASPAMFGRPHGLTDMQSQLASLQSSFLLFREQAKSEMTELHGRMKGLSAVIVSQTKDIADLKKENLKLCEISIQDLAKSSSKQPSGLIEKRAGNFINTGNTYASRASIKTNHRLDKPKSSEVVAKNTSENNEQQIIVVGDINEPTQQNIENSTSYEVTGRNLNKDNKAKTNSQQVTQSIEELYIFPLQIIQLKIYI